MPANDSITNNNNNTSLTTPISWQNSGINSTFTGLQGTIFNWFEVIDDEGDTQRTLIARNSGDSSVMQFDTDYTNYTDADKYQELCDSLIGGYSALNKMKNAGFQHPWARGKYCTAITNIQPMVLLPNSTTDTSENNPNRDQNVEYNQRIVARFTLNFESLGYTQNNGPGKSGLDSYDFITAEQHDSNFRISSVIGMYVFSEGEFENTSATLGLWNSYAISWVNITIHQCDYVDVYGALGSLKSNFNDYEGFTNQDMMFGFDVGTLLLDSTDISEPYGYAFDPNIKIVDVRLNFLYNGAIGGTGSGAAGGFVGWNSGLALDGEFYRIQFAKTGSKPFLTADFISMINEINRVNFNEDQSN